MNFLRIHTSTLTPDRPLTFDVFLKLADKHLLYIYKNDALDYARFQKLSGKKVEYLFIPVEAEPEYRKFLDEGLAQVKGDPTMPLAQKSQLLVGHSKAAVEAMCEDSESKSNYTRAQEVVSVQVQHLIKNPAALEQMLTLENFDKSIYRHSVNVSTLAVGLAHSLGAPENACQAVGTGALLHDMGKAKLGLDHINPDTTLTKEQEEKLRQHPRAGCEVLQGKKYISKDILDIILFHEERIDGKGYPGGIKKLDQIFQVVGLANMYDKLVSFQGMTPKDAFDSIQRMTPPPYDKDLIIGLKDVLATHKLY